MNGNWVDFGCSTCKGEMEAMRRNMEVMERTMIKMMGEMDKMEKRTKLRIESLEKTMDEMRGETKKTRPNNAGGRITKRWTRVIGKIMAVGVSL